MKRTTIYDDFTNKIDEWDFEKNLEIDILSEDTNSVKKCIMDLFQLWLSLC